MKLLFISPVLACIIAALAHTSCIDAQAAENEQTRTNPIKPDQTKSNPASSTAKLAGKWAGFCETPKTLVKMELTIKGGAGTWKAEATFKKGEEESSNPLRNLKISDTEISFSTEIKGADVRFNGKLSGENLAGKFEVAKDDAKEAEGTWNLIPAKVITGVENLPGKWLGTCETAQATVKMRLTLTRDGTDWKAESRFSRGETESAEPVRDLKVNGGEISFRTEIKNAEVRFMGKLAADLAGTFEVLENGSKTPGNWRLEKQ